MDAEGDLHKGDMRLQGVVCRIGLFLLAISLKPKKHV